MLRAVHDADGYPVYLPDDPVSFLRVPGLLGAWVAVDEGDVAGHVLLRETAAPPVMAAASAATGLPEERLAVVSRLLVAPGARRRGAGRALLAIAAREAWTLDRRPVLDVLAVAGRTAATALYEAEGWQSAGVVEVTFASGEAVRELVYVGPAPDDDPLRGVRSSGS